MSESLQLIPNKELQRGRKLGEGGFGIVFKGTWHGYQVAIKTLRMSKLTPDLEKEFMGEARLMAKLNNPAIIHLYGICKEPGAYAMVMEYVPGGDLYHLLSNPKRKLPWSNRWQLAIDIGSGLSFLHSKNILHRDLKSLNVLLTLDLRAKITDFGLSMLRQTSKSLYTTHVKGSIPWMAPELFQRAAKVTKKADVYAYGMVLWEIASRKLPFADAIDPTIIPVWLKEGEREEIPKECPKEYAQVIEACWQPKAEERPEASQALTLLKNAKQGLKVDWSPPPAKTSSPPTTTSTSSVKKGLDFSKWGCLGTLVGHKSEITTLAISSLGHILSGSTDRTIRVWDPTKNYRCIQILQGHLGPITCLIALKNGLVASGSGYWRSRDGWSQGTKRYFLGDGTVKIWDPNQGYTCIDTFVAFNKEDERSPRGPSALLEMPDRKLIGGGWSGSMLKVWDPSQHYKMLYSWKGGPARCMGSCVVVGDRALLATTIGYGGIQIWDPNNGYKLVCKMNHGTDSVLHGLTTLPDGQLVSGGSDQTIKCWDPNKEFKCSATLLGHTAKIETLVSFRGYLLSGSQDKTIRAWSPLTTHKCMKVFEGHDCTIQALVAFGDHVVSGDAEGVVKIWGNCSKGSLQIQERRWKINWQQEVQSWKNIFYYPNNSKGDRYQKLPNPVGTFLRLSNGILIGGLITGKKSKGYYIAPLLKWRRGFTRQESIKGHTDTVSALCQLPGKAFASGSYDKSIRIWDFENEYVCIKTLNQHQHPILGLETLANGMLISASKGGVKVWDPKKDYACVRTFQPHRSWLTAIAILPSGYIVTASDYGSIKLWDPDSYQCIRQIANKGSVTCLQVVARNAFVLGDKLGNLKLIALADRDETIKPIGQHKRGISALYQLPNGYLVSGCIDGLVGVWDLKAKKKMVRIFKAHSGRVTALVLSQMDYLISAADNNVVCAWRSTIRAYH